MALELLMLALGKALFFSKPSSNGLHLLLIWVGLTLIGIEGAAAVAFFLLYIGYTAGVYAVSRHLTDFRWSTATRQLLMWLLPIVGLTFVAARLLPLWPATLAGLIVTLIASLLCLRGLVARIGKDQRIVRQACRVPGVRWACGL